ncbi:hypothetical protein [Sphingomonas sp. CV7422]|uniref:hypothetical protein n=1 Tax=Sphingomonas sp. CV7422 TaxID=3018036 RepID=UPI0022FEA74A|nr:hypothetical protein [Sphingomonas sp. CV7422]
MLVPTRSDVDREANDELANTRRIQRFEGALRRRKQESDAVKERFEIQLVPLAEHPDYAELAVKHLRIGTRRAELSRELSETITSIARGMSAYNKHRIDRQAQAIIDGVEADPFQGFEELRSRQTRLENEVRSHVRAQAQVWSDMETMRSERSIDAAEAVRPAHMSIASVIADACATLQEALRLETAIHDVAKDAGYDDRLRNLQGIANLAELESRARECAR